MPDNRCNIGFVSTRFQGIDGGSLETEKWLDILQPTRIVQRKGIEHAIEMLHRLGKKARLVISHASGDEGDDYESRVRNYAQLLNVPTNFVTDLIRDQRGVTVDGIANLHAVGYLPAIRFRDLSFDY